jgi:phosphatidylinositol-3-phosphatase
MSAGLVKPRTNTIETLSAEESYRRNVREIFLKDYVGIPLNGGAMRAPVNWRTEGETSETAILDLGEFMSYIKHLRTLGALAGLTAAACTANGQEIKKVFVIAMENHNWTQPANQFTGGIQQISQNPNAPFINSLVNGTATAVVDGVEVNISQQVAFANAYHNVLSTPNGANPHIHPSEPNYIWAEAGDNFGVLNDNDPFTGGTNQDTTQHFVTLLTKAGKTWKSYQEDIDLTKNAAGQLTNVVLPESEWFSPINSFSGVFAPGTTNQWNGANQYNYAVKHNPMAFFTDSNGGNYATPSNPLRLQYAPLQQLLTDLATGGTADYNWITPNQFNDMHTTLSGGYKGLTGDPGKILQGDDFLRQIVPIIMASDAYKNHGVIVIWFDESEGDGVSGDNADEFDHTIPEIIISDRVHANVNGLPYSNTVNYTHSSDLRTWQNVFHAGPYLRDAASATDLSDLFQPGAVPRKP